VPIFLLFGEGDSSNMDITSEAARSRAYRLMAQILKRYLEAGVIKTELIGESPALVTMVETELLKIQREFANDFDARQRPPQPAPQSRRR